MAKHVVAITGVTRGLGLAMAREFARLGHTVSGCGRDAAKIESLRKELGAPHYFEAVDVCQDAAVERWAMKTLGLIGTPDFLLNNAALINNLNPLWKVPEAEFNAVIDVNIKGIANTIRHFVPAMIQRSQGVIVNFSSGWGRSTSPEVAPYCATKWAVEGLTLALSQELPAGLAAVSLNPGIINTEMLQQCFQEESAAYPSPDEWVITAVKKILSFGPQDNGKQHSV